MKHLITTFLLLVSLTVSSQTIETTSDTTTTLPQKTTVVKVNSPISEGSPYIIYTGSGVQVASGKVKNSEIDITNISKGFYYIIVAGKTIMIVKD
jgi:hypothetical protein